MYMNIVGSFIKLSILISWISNKTLWKNLKGFVYKGVSYSVLFEHAVFLLRSFLTGVVITYSRVSKNKIYKIPPVMMFAKMFFGLVQEMVILAEQGNGWFRPLISSLSFFFSSNYLCFFYFINIPFSLQFSLNPFPLIEQSFLTSLENNRVLLSN